MNEQQWSRVMRNALNQIDGHLRDNEDGLLDAFQKSKGRMSISLSVKISSPSAWQAEVQSSISYVIDRVKDGETQRVMLDQEELQLPAKKAVAS